MEDNAVKHEQPGDNSITPRGSIVPPNSSPVISPSIPQPLGDTAPPPLKKSRKKLLIIVIAAAALLASGSAAAYVGLIQNSPENIWKKALTTTSEGMKAIIDSSKNNAQTKKFTTFDGSFRADKPTVVDGTLSGSIGNKKFSLKSDVGISGIRVATDLRAIVPDGAKLPDLYVNVSGIKTIGALLGSSDLNSMLSEVDGKWYVIDHTGLEQFGISQQGSTSSFEMSPDEAFTIVQKIQTVMAERLFSTDQSKAVLIIKQKVGSEDFEGTPSYKFKIGVQKQQLKDFATAMKDSLKDTKLKDLLTAASPGKSFEEAIEFDQLLKEIDKTDYTSKTVDVWVASKEHFIRNVRFVEGDTTTDLGLEKIGEEIPVYVRTKAKELTTKITTTLNRVSNTVKLAVDVSGKSGGQDTAITGNVTFTPVSEEPKIEKPTGATNAMELLSGFMNGFSAGLNSTLGGGATSEQQLYLECINAAHSTAEASRCFEDNHIN